MSGYACLGRFPLRQKSRIRGWRSHRPTLEAVERSKFLAPTRSKVTVPRNGCPACNLVAILTTQFLLLYTCKKEKLKLCNYILSVNLQRSTGEQNGIAGPLGLYGGDFVFEIRPESPLALQTCSLLLCSFFMRMWEQQIHKYNVCLLHNHNKLSD